MSPRNLILFSTLVFLVLCALTLGYYLPRIRHQAELKLDPHEASTQAEASAGWAAPLTDQAPSQSLHAPKEKLVPLGQLKEADSQQPVPVKPIPPEQPDIAAKNRILAQQRSEAAKLRARIAQQWAAYQKLPRRAFVGTKAVPDIYAPYVNDWVARVEQVAKDNYPESVRVLGKHDSLHLTVSIQADGNIEKIEIDKPSKHKALNDAAKQIIQQAAPFAAFTSEMRRHADILSITRNWTFTPADQLISDR